MKSAAILLAAAAITGSASAQTVSQPPRYEGSLAGFSGSPEALPRAIAAIERSGGRVMEIRYDGSQGPGYIAVVARGQNLEFDHASEPVTGLTVLSSNVEPAWVLGWRGRAELRADRKAKVDLATAVRTAEAQDGGPAVAAGIAPSAANPSSEVKAYNVLIRTPSGALRRVAIDAATGVQIQNPSALREWP